MLVARPEPGPVGAHYFRVAELVAYIRDVFARDPVLGDVWVAGEMSDISRSPAGHWYFSLRDAEARLGVVLFRLAAQRQRGPLAEGYQALVHGAVEIYSQRSLYQLVADVVLPGDAGRLRAQFEALRLRLEKEGLFAPERKRSLPPFPKRIGVVTSESGAAVHDLLKVWERRFPLAEVVLAPTPVQGEEAAVGVVAALERLASYHRARKPVDVIVVARGGGSPEELAVFNDESIARAIFACPVPVVSAIGHEVDWTIADLVADLRAPTPSAAAEMVAPDVGEIRRHAQQLSDRSRLGVRRRLAEERTGVGFLAQRLGRRSPAAVIADGRRRTDELVARAGRAARTSAALARSGVEAHRLRLLALNPEGTLQRGYALCTRADDGALVTDSGQVAIGEQIAVRLARGRLVGEVIGSG